MREVMQKRIYCHFKGDYYLVDQLAACAEIGETRVAYRKLVWRHITVGLPYKLFAFRSQSKQVPALTPEIPR